MKYQGQDCLVVKKKKKKIRQQVDADRLWLISITASQRLIPSDSQIYLFFILKTLISKQHKNQTFCVIEKKRNPPNTQVQHIHLIANAPN